MKKPNEKQKECLALSSPKAKITLCYGPYRCGKTIFQAYKLGFNVCRAFKEVTKPMFIAMAKNKTNCHTNIAKNCRDVWNVTSADYDPRNESAICPEVSNLSPQFSLMGAPFICVGWSNVSSANNVLGQNVDGIAVDEGVCVPEEVFRALQGRADRPHMNICITTNPGGTRHYLKTEVVDKADGEIIEVFNFKLSDNPALDPAYIDFLKKSYHGVYYKRYVEGEWADATGLVYPFFGDIHLISDYYAATEYIVGLDYGQWHPTAAVLVGYNPAANPPIWVEREFVTDPKDPKYASITDIVREFWTWLGDITPSVIYVDPAAASIQSELLRYRGNVVHAQNNVSEGIACVMRLFSLSYAKIYVGCHRLIDEMYRYSWDEKKSATSGKDMPLKEHDDAVDALRYALFSHFGQMDLDKEVEKTEHKQSSWNYYNSILGVESSIMNNHRPFKWG